VFVSDGEGGGARVDPVSSDVRPFQVPHPPCTNESGFGCLAGGIAVGGGGVWLAAWPQTAWRLDPNTLRVDGRVPHVFAESLAWGAGGVWAYSGYALTAAQIDPGGTRSSTAT
jgi:hypothetical protein